MDQAGKAHRFADLHIKGQPLVLYNIWDAGSARAVVEAGAGAVATGSWSLAAAQGFKDGQAIPLELVEMIVKRIVSATDAPVTVDFEAGYGDTPSEVAANAARIIEAGAVGINFEDGIPGAGEMRDVRQQCARIRAVREKADELGVPLFINARTDLFLQSDSAQHGGLVAEAEARAAAYAEAGAGGFFVPGLLDEAAIERLCRVVALPVNVMMTQDAPAISRLAEVGVSRVSFGPLPFIRLMGALKRQAQEIHSSG
ncbi:MAG: isocitrate lyase/phosphoenolpyruvate mutase family protein [Alphaproteobacteria bacterium]